MKYKSEKTLRKAKKAFSLIELMIVIVIIGALTAIILPQFDVSEAEAKDAGCDASNYGTLSQLTKFRSLHGCFPAGMHTGFTDASAATIMGGDYAAIPSFTYYNLSTGTAAQALSSDASLSGYTDSLREAGITYLSAGGFPQEASDANTCILVTYGVTAGAGSIRYVTGPWYEAWSIDTATGMAIDTQLDTTSTEISVNGIPLQYYTFADPRQEYSDGSTPVYGDTAEALVVPLFLAPTTDWDHWYDSNGAQNDSKIQVAQVGQCPWLEGGVEFRFYIALFQVFKSGDKAKLIGTMCPEGGSLNP